MEIQDISWSVSVRTSVQRAKRGLPRKVQSSLFALIREMELYGPVRGNWPNYSKLGKSTHHCHLKDGKPAYVAVWEVVDRRIRIIEVMYAGTREGAPY